MSTQPQQVKETEPLTDDMELPEGWAEAPLGGVADLESGAGFPEKHQGKTGLPYPFFKVGNLGEVQSGESLQTSAHTVDDRLAKELHAKIIPPDSVVFAKIGMAIQLNRRRLVGVHCCIDNNMMAAIPTGAISSRYLLRFLETIPFMELATATTVPSLRKSELEKIKVLVPPFDEQHRLVGASEALLANTKIAKGRLERTSLLMKHFRQAVLAAACSGKLTEDWREQNPNSQTGNQLFRSVVGQAPMTFSPDAVPIDGLPDSWAWATLGQVSLLVTDGDHNPPKRVSSGIPHLTAKSIKEWRINFDGCTFITEEDFEKTRSRYEPKACDLIITCVGTIGETAIVPRSCVFSADRNLAAIRLRLNALLPAVAQYVLNAPPWINIVREGSSSTAQPHLYLKTLRALIVPLIPLVEQHEIVCRVEALFKLADAIEKRLGAATLRAERLTQAILAKAFRGELVPTEAELARREGREYEPASVLLERIKNEREKAGSEKPKRRARVSARG
jgi:type I restriction enzyme, S subunit